MGKDAGSAPQAPDPTKIIPVQSAADRLAFNYQTAANRYNTFGPDQSQTWSMTPQFDQAGYDKALADWQAGNSQGTWVPGTPGSQQYSSEYQGMVDMPGTPGYWSGATSNGAPQPNKQDFTTQQWSLNTQLSPEQQALHDAQLGAKTDQASLVQALLAKLSPSLGSAFDTSSVGGFSTDPGVQGYIDKLGQLDPTAFSTAASDAAYNQATRYLDPQVEQQQKQLEARLAEQGFVPGTPGYQQAFQNFMDANNRQYAQARDAATTQGFNIGHMQFGDQSNALNSQIAAALNAFGAGNQAHAQGVQELLQQRQVPQSDLNTMLSYLYGSGNPTNAGSAAVPQGGVGALQNPDQIAAYNQQYQDLLGQYNANVSSNNNTTSTIGGLIGAIAIAF